jgi:hypothetical protein
MLNIQTICDGLIEMGESYGLMPIQEGRTDKKLQVRYNSRLYSIISTRGNVRHFYFRSTATDEISTETLNEYLAFYKTKIQVKA